MTNIRCPLCLGNPYACFVDTMLPAKPPPALLEAMARAMHKRFRDGNKTKLVMCPTWEELTPIAQGDWLDYARAAYDAGRKEMTKCHYTATSR